MYIQINETENSSETDPHIYGQLIFYKGAKGIQWKKYNLLNKWQQTKS